MGKTIKLEPEVEKEATANEEPKQQKTKKLYEGQSFFKSCSLYMKCEKCGEDRLLDDKVSGGLAFQVPATLDNKLMLKCGACDNTIYLHFVENEVSHLDGIENAEIISETEPEPVVQEETGQTEDEIAAEMIEVDPEGDEVSEDDQPKETDKG